MYLVPQQEISGYCNQAVCLEAPPQPLLWLGCLRFRIERTGEFMRYRLGLDIGISSVGWAVLLDMPNGEPYKIENLGVRIFEKAEQPKTGASLALPRREARSARRRIRRKRHRKERLKELFQTTGLISRKELDILLSTSNFAKDVYTLRAEGLDRALNQEEWARVLLHLSQRRGYHSNSTAAENGDKESGTLKKAIAENQERMKANGYRTVGEMFAQDKIFKMTGPDGKAWRKTRNTAGDYSFTVTRTMVKDEVQTLFQIQREMGNPFAVASLEEQYCRILFSQRGYDAGPGGDSPFQKIDLRGNCTFENDERRAYKACYTFEYFKLLQDINHIRLLSEEQGSRNLTSDERKLLIDLTLKKNTLHYGHLRKALNLPDSLRFNVVRYRENTAAEAEKKTKFQEMQSYHVLRKALDHVSKNYIDQFSHDQLDQIAEILCRYKSDEQRISELKKLYIDQESINALLPLSFGKVGNLSIKAMKKMIPHLETGINYDEAARIVYGDHRKQGDIDRKETLSYGQLYQAGVLNGITNPVVLRAVSQTCKVVNAIVRQYGSPETIHIELAREMSRNYTERMNMENRYQDNQAKNERMMRQIEEIKGRRATGQDLVKFKLFQEQKEVCLYSGVKLDSARLFEEGYVEVDHIIPYSISFDDSYQNKVLVLSAENQRKGNRLPLAYMEGNPEKIDRFLVLVETHIGDYRKKQKLLKRALTEEDMQGFKRRNLIDTQYITREIYNLLNDYLKFAEDSPFLKKPVRAVNGVVTDYMRKRLGLQKNRADGDLHHAMDAVIVAVTTDRVIQRISNYSKRREWGKKIRGSYVDPETGELLSQKDFDEKYAPTFPPPWPTFRQEVEARLSSDPDAEIRAKGLPNYDPEEIVQPVFVSRMPNRKTSGPAHKETIRSGNLPGYSIVKTALTDLKRTKDGEIQGYYDPSSDRILYEALKARLAAFDGNAKKAFAAPFYKPKKDGTQGPIVKKVKTYEKSNLNVPVRGGIADNGAMVRIDVFYVPEDGYYFVPIYTADTVKAELPQKAVVANKSLKDWKEMQDDNFLFSLYAGDLIRVTSKKTISMKLTNEEANGEPELKRNEWMLYFVSADISTGSITLTTHDRKYQKRSLGIKTLLSIEKYEVDPLGNYHKVHIPEKRLSFQ